MGQHEAIVIGLFVAPVLVLMLLRINATMVFLSLCLGYLVMQLLTSDVQAFATTFMTHAAVSANTMKLGLLLFPAVLTALFMIGTARGSRLILNVLPALAVGCLAALLVVPLLPPGMAHAIMGIALWHQALRLQSVIVGTGALISLFFLWAQRPRRASDDRSSRRH